jgi:hypothetical protein
VPTILDNQNKKLYEDSQLIKYLEEMAESSRNTNVEAFYKTEMAGSYSDKFSYIDEDTKTHERGFSTLNDTHGGIDPRISEQFNRMNNLSNKKVDDSDYNDFLARRGSEVPPPMAQQRVQ